MDTGLARAGATAENNGEFMLGRLCAEEDEEAVGVVVGTVTTSAIVSAVAVAAVAVGAIAAGAIPVMSAVVSAVVSAAMGSAVAATVVATVVARIGGSEMAEEGIESEFGLFGSDIGCGSVCATAISAILSLGSTAFCSGSIAGSNSKEGIELGELAIAEGDPEGE